MICWN